jgi:LAO/AO transport system kinase
MLELSAETATSSGWKVPITTTIASNGDGVPELWEIITTHRDHVVESGELERRRRFRLGEELRDIVARRLEQRARDVCTGERWDALTDDVLTGRVDPWTAADEMLAPVLSFTSRAITRDLKDSSGSAGGSSPQPG